MVRSYYHHDTYSGEGKCNCVACTYGNRKVWRGADVTSDLTRSEGGGGSQEEDAGGILGGAIILILLVIFFTFLAVYC